MAVKRIIEELQNCYNEDFAIHHAKFFKTGSGEYGEGDLFYGLKVPQVRNVAKKYFKNASLTDISELLKNPYHEVRLCALVMMVEKFNRADEELKAQIAELYLKNVAYINNWDLVDISAPNIPGPFWYKKDLTNLWKLAGSGHLWSERISVLASFYFIKQGEFLTTLELCEFFLAHQHDLMHKATGWMLREIGKRDIEPLYSFLDKFHKTMPRTMLRYSIEKLSQERKDFYMGRVVKKTALWEKT